MPTLLPVRLALLGPVAVDDGEVPLDLGPPKQRALLALLASAGPALRGRLEQEAARRGQPVPVVHRPGSR